MTIVWTDRSRVETHQRCARLRYLEYHQGGRGISAAKKPLPLAVGGSTHKGLERLLRESQSRSVADIAQWLPFVEDAAVDDALADFATHRSALALDTAELASAGIPLPVADAGFPAQVAAAARDLGMDADDPAIAELFQRERNAAADYDDHLYREQAALVEGLVRAYARRRLRPLLEEFEVLEVEREGDWCLYERDELGDCNPYKPAVVSPFEQIRFMSRPDALLRNRADNSLYLLSYKTAATWDVRKARDAEHDMQGLSEGVEVERRLAAWWWAIQQSKTLPDESCSSAMYEFLHGLPSPPRILGIRMEYLLKGYRSEDKELTARFGIRVWSQRSHLLRRYVAHSTPSRGKNASAYDVGAMAWSWDYHTEDGATSKLSTANWHAESAWDKGDGIRGWIDLLDATVDTMSAYDSTTGAEPRSLGWSGPAQGIGYTSGHPLDEVFPAPLTIYRSDDQLRDLVEQLEYQERRVAESVAAVNAATDDGERRSRLNQHFAQSRRACEYPSTCGMVKVCWGGEDIQRDPVGSGLYKIRVANHQQEKDAAAAKVGLRGGE